MRGSTPRTDVSFCPHRSMVGQQIVDLHTGVQFSLGALRFLLVGIVIVGQFLSKASETFVASMQGVGKGKRVAPSNPILFGTFERTEKSVR